MKSWKALQMLMILSVVRLAGYETLAYARELAPRVTVDKTRHPYLPASVPATNVILDVTGYFAAKSLLSDGLATYPVAPCRRSTPRSGEYGQPGTSVLNFLARDAIGNSTIIELGTATKDLTLLGHCAVNPQRCST